jgi:hypothetical protein
MPSYYRDDATRARGEQPEADLDGVVVSPLTTCHDSRRGGSKRRRNNLINVPATTLFFWPVERQLFRV